MEQQIRFCTTTDGVRIAYATFGEGPPLVYVCGWPLHLDLEWDTPSSRAFLEELGRGFTLVRYDMRGGGLSDRDAPDLEVESLTNDLAAVIDHLGLERAPLLSLGLLAGPVAMTYAARQPDRVSLLVLGAPYLDGSKIITPERRRALVDYATNFGFPFADIVSEPFLSADEVRQVRRHQTAAAEPAMQGRLLEAMFSANVEAIADQVTAPALVLHARHDPYVPFALGREVALRLPNAELRPFDADTPAVWQQSDILIPEIHRFVNETLAAQATGQSAR